MLFQKFIIVVSYMCWTYLELPLTKVFEKAGLDNVTSAMCKHQQRFGLDINQSALVLNFNNIFSNGHLYRAGQTVNSLPSQILERCAKLSWSIILL
jgi:hypothetical protein